MNQETNSDRPVFDPGDFVCSENADFAFRIIELIGEGRCCLVYSARSLRDSQHKVALKCFKRGPHYEGAIQREQFILDTFGLPGTNIVSCLGFFEFQGIRCEVMPLMEHNIRQIIFRNDRQGLSPWATQKFASDLLTAVSTLHRHSYVHGDLKPANLMWSSVDGCFKLLDFGLTFHTDELDLHQIQSTGYKAPEVSDWNKYRDDLKRKRKRKLQGTYTDLSTTVPAPAFVTGLDSVGREHSIRMTSAAEVSLQPATGLQSNKKPPLPAMAPPPTPAAREDDVDCIPYSRTGRKKPLTCSSMIKDRWPSQSSGIDTGSIRSSVTETDMGKLARKNEEVMSVSGTSYSDESSSLLLMLSQQTTSAVSESNASWISSRDTTSSDGSKVSFSVDLDSATLAPSQQEWRRGRSRNRGPPPSPSPSSATPRRAPRPTSQSAAADISDDDEAMGVRRPALPNESSDMWSFGCLLVEVLTGRKLFSATDKMAHILKPHQLLEMKLGPTEIRYDQLNQQLFFSHAKDLIQKCLHTDPRQRIASGDALRHPFFTAHWMWPNLKDLQVLPSTVLTILDAFGNPLTHSRPVSPHQDTLGELREEAEKYGCVVRCCARDGHAFIEFEEASDCQRAWNYFHGCLGTRNTVIFYPAPLWAHHVFLLSVTLT